MLSRVVPAVFAAVAILAAGCAEGGSGAQAGPGPLVVVTTTILGDLVASLVGEDAQVEVLMPPGADPHAYGPSAAQADLLRSADLVVANGLDFEEALVPVLDAAEADGVTVFRATDAIEVIDGADGPDPHVWHDPLRMADVVRALAARLALLPAADLGSEEDWTARGDAAAAALVELDAEVTQTLLPIPQEDRVLVTNHESLAYLAARYDLMVLASVIPGTSSLAEPSAADLDDVVDAIRTAGVPAIFVETSSSQSLADVVAAEIGPDVAVVALYSESLSEAGGPAASYPALMRTNAQRIADALGSGA